MNNQKIFTILGTVVALTIFPPFLNKANSQASQHFSADKIVGTWRVLVTPGQNVRSPFYVYITFNQEGTLIQSSSDDELEGGRPGHGVWNRIGKNNLKVVFEKFINLNPITRQQGVFRVEEEIHLIEANNYQGTANVLVCNTAGNDCNLLGTSLTQGNRLR